MSLAISFSGEVLPGVSPDVYGDADFRAIAAIVHDEAGIVLPPGKAMLVYSRIAPLVRASGTGTFGAFIQHIRTHDADRKRAIDALTTNHTFFFRENHHFEHLRNEVRPRLLKALGKGQGGRVWSAGCSSGEETWSIVMTLLGEDRIEGRRIATQDLRVLASDLAAHALAKASAATYGQHDVRDVPDALARNWLQPSGDSVTLSDVARSIVRFRELNLLGEWPMRRPFDVIFCRNVMIYFDQATKDRLVERFAAVLRPGGTLCIGHSERVTGPATRLLEPVGTTIYRRRG